MTQPMLHEQDGVEVHEIPNSKVAIEREAEEDSSAPAVTELLSELLASMQEIRDELGDLRASLGAEKNVATSSVHAPQVMSLPAAKHDAYRHMTARLREFVAASVPKGATVAVVSKGDEELLAFGGVRAWHFPRYDSGVYTGHHPADCAAALAHLDAVREKGAEFLVIPQTSFWWLDHYPKFRDRLVSGCRQVARAEDTGVIFQIRERSAVAPQSVAGGGYARLCIQLRDFITSIVPKKSRIAVISKGDPELIDFPGIEAEHFPTQEDGLYSGHHPADSDEAIAHLMAFRANGGGFLLIPKPALWWLDFYGEFRECLHTQGRLISRQQHLGTLFFLTGND